ncbi:MAG: M20/M25/M40 family metallo-hydrolase [Tissierellia bacterium]|nr:M20/M25/M40 family metallo-hydrolase [Tissierellia bacterium]
MNFFEEVKKLTKDLVAIESIVREGQGESQVAKYIFDFYGSLDYFKTHQDQVLLQKTEDDPVDRHNAISLVKGTKGKSRETVILMGHIDTVGVDDFHEIKDLAFNPEALPEALKKLAISQKVREDIDSGNYLFGRGALDMKSGVAGHMAMMKYFSEHPEELEGNLIHLAECDEEDNSHGAISALRVLEDWKDKFDLDYIAAINADYSIPNDQDGESRNIYLGTIGKLLPSFYVYGKETHVGEPFGGLDPNQIMAQLTRQINLNVALCDEDQGELAPPPMGLKQADSKIGYTVQTALAAYGYFNYFTHAMSPKEVMDRVEKVAVQAFDQVIEDINQNYKTYCQLKGLVYRPRPWKTRVYTFKDFYRQLEEKWGPDFTRAYASYTQALHEGARDLDLRLFSNQVIQWMWENWVEDKSPAIIIYFGSVYSAPIQIRGEEAGEKRLLEALDQAIIEAQKTYDKKIYTKYFYPFISDSSFMKVSDDEEGLRALEDNMPAWGSKYIHPSQAIKKINVPVINIGTVGYDGHKITERVDMDYTFRVVPDILYRTLKALVG